MTEKTEQDITNVITWQELKDFCNGLPQDQLNKKVIWVGEDSSGTLVSVEKLTEDVVNGWVLRSEYEQTKEENDDPEPQVVHEKGTAIIFLKF